MSKRNLTDQANTPIGKRTRSILGEKSLNVPERDLQSGKKILVSNFKNKNQPKQDDHDDENIDLILNSPVVKVDSETKENAQTTKSSTEPISLQDADQEIEEEESQQRITSYTNAHKESLVRLQQLLARPDKAAKLESGGEATELPSQPGLQINQIGLVPLPLEDAKAVEIINEFKKTSKKSRSCRQQQQQPSSSSSIFELDASSFQLKNPDWNKKLETLLARVAKTLGCGDATNVKPKLTKLLILVPKDRLETCSASTENTEPSQFATLVVQLPSNYSGGELTVSRADSNSRVKHDLGQKSGKAAFSVHFAAYLSRRNVELEVARVSSGYCLRLVYSLCWSEDRPATAAIRPSSVEAANEICKIMKSLALVENNRLSLFLVNETYAAKEIKANGVKALMGIDLSRYELLKSVNDTLPDEFKYEFFLARVSNLATIHLRYNNHVIQSDQHIQKLYNEDGKVVVDLQDSEFPLHAALTQVLNPQTRGTNEALLDEKSLKKNLKLWGNSYEPVYEYGDESSYCDFYTMFMLVLWPRRTRFVSLLTFDWRGGALDDLEARFDPSSREFMRDLNMSIEACGVETPDRSHYWFEVRKQVASLLKRLNRDRVSVKFLRDLLANHCGQANSAKCMRELGFKVLKQSLEQLAFTSPSIKQLHQFCSLVKNFLSLNEKECAEFVWRKRICPSLKEPEILKTLVKDSYQRYYNTVEFIYDLLEAAVNFEETQEIKHLAVIALEGLKKNDLEYLRRKLMEATVFKKLKRLETVFSILTANSKPSSSTVEQFEQGLQLVQNVSRIKDEEEMVIKFLETIIFPIADNSQLISSIRTKCANHCSAIRLVEIKLRLGDKAGEQFMLKFQSLFDKLVVGKKDNFEICKCIIKNWFCNFKETPALLQFVQTQLSSRQQCSTYSELDEKCKIISGMIDINQDLAKELFQKHVVSVINQTYELVKLLNEAFANKAHNQLFYTLAETILVFGKAEQLNMHKLKAFITISLQPEQMKELVDMFRKNMVVFGISPVIRSIFEIHIDWLRKQLRQIKSYAILGAVFPHVAAIEQFLRSEHRSYVHGCGVLKSREEAFAFVKLYGNQLKNIRASEIRVVAKCQGKRDEIHVVIEKQESFKAGNEALLRELEDLSRVLKLYECYK